MPNQNDKAYLFLHYWQLLAPSTAPQPEAEYPFSLVVERKHRADWAFPANHILVEVDGGQHVRNGGRHNTDADREKGNLAASLHYLVFHFSPEMLERDPAGCVELVLSAMKPTPAPNARERKTRQPAMIASG